MKRTFIPPAPALRSLPHDPTVHWPHEVDPAKGACPTCAGAGHILEQFDEEKFPVPVPCPQCERRKNGRRK